MQNELVSLTNLLFEDFQRFHIVTDNSEFLLQIENFTENTGTTAVYWSKSQMILFYCAIWASYRRYFWRGVLF